MKKIWSGILYALLWTLALLPMRVLYLFSDISYLLVYRVARYRLKVVRQNLRRSFPEKNNAELRAIERKFYRYLCDLLFEALHMLHMSERQMVRHIKFENPEVLENYALEGRNVYAVFGHYGNWEWICSLPLQLRPDLMSVSTLYKTLHDSALDSFYLRLRSRFGTHCYPNKQVLRGIVDLKSMGKPFVMAFIADQTPSLVHTHYWTTFLHQDTAFITGWETLARKHNAPVIFLQMKRVKRGYYTCHFVPICDQPKDAASNSLIETYAHLMEQNIQENPAFWLWSHRRWKHRRPISEEKSAEKTE